MEDKQDYCWAPFARSHLARWLASCDSERIPLRLCDELLAPDSGSRMPARTPNRPRLYDVYRASYVHTHISNEKAPLLKCHFQDRAGWPDSPAFAKEKSSNDNDARIWWRSKMNRNFLLRCFGKFPAQHCQRSGELSLRIGLHAFIRKALLPLRASRLLEVLRKRPAY